MSKKVITFAICDDDSIFLEKIKNKIYSVFKNDISCFFEIECITCNSSNELFSYYEKHDIDIAILDIELGEESGFDVAKKFIKLKNEIGIIFATSYSNYIYHSFVCRPLAFIRKNDFDTDFDFMFSNIIEYLESKFIIFEFGIYSDKINIKLSEIRAVDVYDHVAHIKLEDKVLKCRDKISRFENNLIEYGFIKIDRGCILNLKYIQKFDGVCIKMIDNSIYQTSRGLRKNVQERLKSEGIG